MEHYKSEKQKIIMKQAKSKNKKLSNAVKKITQFQEENVLQRYLRYVKDQHAFQFLSWRQRVKNLDLTTAEVIGFKFRISLIKKRLLMQRKLEENQEVAEFGEPIAHLIPCLDPDKAESKKHFTPEQQKVRFLTDVDAIMKIASVEFTLEELAHAYPIFYNFYPTPEVMKKLIVRMTQIKEDKAAT